MEVEKKKKRLSRVLSGFLIVTPLVLMLLLLGAFIYWRWDAKENRGHHFGYWGQFNNVKDTLTALPGVTVEKSWVNSKDILLAEFGFALQVNGQPVYLGFGATDPIRKMSGKERAQELMQRIEKQRASGQPPSPYTGALTAPPGKQP